MSPPVAVPPSDNPDWSAFAPCIPPPPVQYEPNEEAPPLTPLVDVAVTTVPPVPTVTATVEDKEETSINSIAVAPAPPPPPA